jgi:hypothetical protein
MRMSMAPAPGPIRLEPPPPPPSPGPDPWEREITFISGVAANATVAAISYGSWSAAVPPATYSPTFSDATKWGDTTLSPSGTPGGEVSYWFDAASNWNEVEESMWLSAMNLWSAEVNITFVGAADASSADFTLYRQPHQPDSEDAGRTRLFPIGSPRPSAAASRARPAMAPSSRSAATPPRSTARSKPRAAMPISPWCTNSVTCSGSGTAGRTTAWQSRTSISSRFTIRNCGRSCPTSSRGIGTPSTSTTIPIS